MGYLDEIDKRKSLSIAEQLKLQEEEDEREIRRLLGKNEEGKFERRLNDINDEDDYDDDDVANNSEPGPSSSAKFGII